MHKCVLLFTEHLMKKNKDRLDLILLNKGMANNLSHAQSLILSKSVLVNGHYITQVGSSLPVDSKIELRKRNKYVSRGGIKLEHALKMTEISNNNKKCLDIGVSTGGFTDCLLQNGALFVEAIDSGYGQAADKIRNHSKVKLRERTNARYIDQLDQLVDIITIDVSFISILKILPNIRSSLKSNGDIIALVKPQFELPKKFIPNGGVVIDHLLHSQAIAKIVISLLKDNFIFRSVVRSPIKGASGNREFFIWMQNNE